MTPEEFFKILYDVPPVIEPSRRLYHDDQGQPLFYTMEDLPGDYIEVDAFTYAAARFDVLIKNGRVTELPRKRLVNKLRPADEGVCCDPRDICLVVDAASPHIRWSMKDD